MAVTNNEFTDRERELMAFAWTCMDSEPKVDYKKLAAMAGMGNPASASNAWARIKKKIQAHAESAGAGGDAAAAATPKAATAGKKRAKPASASATPAAEGEEGGESPKKKARKPRVKKEVVEEEPVEEGAEGEGEETML